MKHFALTFTRGLKMIVNYRKLATYHIQAFTLIELLIVVAIIAILAAIAVPNFLEAQTRAKVARVASDLRTYDTAVETYRIDHNKLPPTYRLAGQTRLWMTHYLTTPISYINGGLPDTFNKVDTPENRYIVSWGPDYYMLSEATWAKNFQFFPTYSDGASKLSRHNFFYMFSLGPDQKYDVLDPAWPSPVQQYDASNGTVSRGDVARFNG